MLPSNIPVEIEGEHAGLAGDELEKKPSDSLCKSIDGFVIDRGRA
jgi:hypothetical protein